METGGGFFSNIFGGYRRGGADGKKGQEGRGSARGSAREGGAASGGEEVPVFRQFYPDIREGTHYQAEQNIHKGIRPVNLPRIPGFMRASGENSPRSMMETKIIKNLIHSYFNVVRKNVNDSVPKTIMAFLVNQVKKIAQRELVSQLYTERSMESLLEEDPLIGKKREACKKVLGALRRSFDLLNDIRDFYFKDAYD